MSVASVGYFPVSPPNGDVRPQTAVRHENTSDRPEVRTENRENSNRRNSINSTAADLERISLVFNKTLRFVLDHNSNEVIVKVIDRETDKVIKELPPEELQRLHTDLREVMGFLFDERV